MIRPSALLLLLSLAACSDQTEPVAVSRPAEEEPAVETPTEPVADELGTAGAATPPRILPTQPQVPTIPFDQEHGYEALLPDLYGEVPRGQQLDADAQRRRMGDKMIDRMIRGLLDPEMLSPEDRLVYDEAMARFQEREAALREAAAGDQDG